MDNILNFTAEVSLKPAENKYVWDGKCEHWNAMVDKELSYLICRNCGEHLDPIQYLYKLSIEERAIEFRLTNLQKLEKQILNKNKCKCEHCQKMTTIVR